MKKHIAFTAIAMIFGLAAAPAEVDCLKIAVEVRNAVQNSPDAVLEEVASRVATSPSCACEIVKAAIEASSANEQMVAAIVETAATAAPDQMRIIAQCAVAVAPDALANVQAVLAKLDPNSGESYSAKSAKGEKAAIQEVASMGNPLDFPGKGPVGPLPIFPGPPGFFVPLDPDVVTEVNPQP
jgi:hypothetical protein